MSFKNLESNEAYVSLFSSSEGKKALRGVYDYYTDIKLGLWNVNLNTRGKTTEFLISETKEELTIIINTKLERNLTKKVRESIKGKVSKDDYKSSNYHQIGTIKYSLKIEWVENGFRIIKGKKIEKLNTVRQ